MRTPPGLKRRLDVGDEAVFVEPETMKYMPRLDSPRLAPWLFLHGFHLEALRRSESDVMELCRAVDLANAKYQLFDEDVRDWGQMFEALPDGGSK